MAERPWRRLSWRGWTVVAVVVLAIAVRVALPYVTRYVLVSQGGVDGGYSLYVKDHKLHYDYNYVAAEQFHVESKVTLPSGKLALCYEFEPTGEPDIALFRNEAGDFFATEDNCTHEDWSLGTDSDLEDEEVTCPLHMARFDIRTGKPLCFPATIGLKTFEVEVDGDGRVFVLG